MTGSTVRPETGTRQFSFALGGTLSSLPYGQFFRDGRAASKGAYFATSSALSGLDRFVETDQIPADEQAAIVGDIQSAGLPEKEPYHGPYRFVAEKHNEMVGAHFFANTDGVVLGNGSRLLSKEAARSLLESAIERGAVLPNEREGLLKAINDSELPEDDETVAMNSLMFLFGTPEEPERVGPFTFEVVQNGDKMEGRVLDKDGKIVTSSYSSKAEAIYEINRHTEDGHFKADDHDSILKQVEDSQLPNGWTQEISFKMCTCPNRLLHYYAYVDDEKMGGPFFTVAESDLFLTKVAHIGVITEVKAEEIRNEMRANGLPESFGD
ncbi:MAG: hypothetical protein WA051_01490 [Minisyncoccia bacterium]